ncbi:lanthionine synthetase LanC family protein [Streptomyces sp. NPDC006463]|uniref:lanthionine synthetase LanC family protein n=1 Tax=Streptomyces sp. NPDC006463 TaxID=3364746 RepID=UPI0036D1219E
MKTEPARAPRPLHGRVRPSPLAGRAHTPPRRLRPRWRHLWTDTAHAALRATAARSRTAPEMSQPGLCHGLGGLLVALEAFREERASDVLDEAIETTVQNIIRRHRPADPFGFTVPQEGSGLRLDHPGFLDGVTGMLLALWRYATNEPPRSGWEAALLLS